MKKRSQRSSSKILNLVSGTASEDEPDNLIRNYDGNLISVHGAPIIRALAKGLGVTFNIVIQKDDDYGFKKPDGNWTGIIGMLERGEADLSHVLTLTDERREVVYFTHPVHVTDVAFMTDKPEPNSKSFAVFDVFSFEVWISIGICLSLISLFLYFLLKGRKTYSTILFECIGCLLEKSFSFNARQRNTALLLLFWFLGITVLTNSYKAVILSVITVPRMVGIRDITGLSKAAEENSIMCMTFKGSVLFRYEKTDERFGSTAKCLKRGAIESLYNYEDFLKYPLKKAYIAERIDLNKFIRDYVISDDSFSISHLAIPYSKKFCCPEKLQNVVLRIVAADLYPKYMSDRDFIVQLRQSYPKNEVHDGATWKPLTLKDFTGAFLVLFIGHLCSLVTFIAEIISKTNTLKHMN